uniref:C3/C5 convertase n=1 Tax=Stegastes partitus TaxID=144197 RepID=A0A3B4ZS29_9TELE
LKNKHPEHLLMNSLPTGEVRCDCTETNMQIQGGNYTLTKRLETGSILVYNCPEGYYPYPHLTRLCQPNGSWRPAPRRFPTQRCKIVECPDPNVLEYGNVNPPQEKYLVTNVTTYDCYSGYTLRGSTSRRCLPNGKWSGSTPICSRDSGDNCADPGIPPGASRTGNIFGIDDTVKYACNGNLFLVGSSERVCQENGQWTGKEPACYYKHTYDTPLEVTESFGSAIKDSLTTLEPIDDTQEGRKIRISKNGTLNIYIAVDISESIENDHFVNARNAVLKLIQKISSFSVTPNYEIVFFSSDIYEVVNILDFLDGKATLSKVTSDLEKFEVGDRNTGTDLNQVFKIFMERMAIIKRRAGDEGFKEHRHVLIFFTDGAYNMGGSPVPTVERIKNMVYMNNTSEQQKQSREEFLDIYVFAIGAEIFDDDLHPLTAGTGGRHYFRMKDIKNLQDTFDEIIDEEEVKGLCGLHKVYDQQPDQHNFRKMYPWVAFIYNDGGSIQLKVKTFTLHPKYNVTAKVKQGVKEFYDYDVALIQLEKDVRISASARPICIPCTQETSDALHLVGDSTCKQQEELLLKNHLERLSFLTRKGEYVGVKDVHAKLGDNRAQCIKQALNAKGITTKNEHDAVTDNFLCTGGKNPFRDHIACTGDSGGAVFKNYELRTVQIAVVSWGTKEICTAGGVVESHDDSRDFHINLFKVVPFLKSILGNDNQDDYAPLKFLDNLE